MPSTIEELEAAIQDTLEQAGSILLLNQNVLAEYELRQRKVNAFLIELNIHLVTLMLIVCYYYAWKIETLAKTLEEEEHGLGTLLAEIDALKVICFY